MPKTPPYSKEFRVKAVRLLRSGGRPVPELARELGCSSQSLRNWSRQIDTDQGRAAGLTSVVRSVMSARGSRGPQGKQGREKCGGRRPHSDPVEEEVDRARRGSVQSGPEWGSWLLRGLIECGHCHVGCNCHKMRGRNGNFHRYYYCRNHDLLRAGGEDRRCPERNIRANELDEYVFAQVRQALLDPRQLIAGEHAVIAGTPLDEDELIANQLNRISTSVQAAELERTRLLDAYQAGLLELDELTRRTATLTTQRDQLARERDTLTERSAELATENRLRRGLASDCCGSSSRRSA